MISNHLKRLATVVHANCSHGFFWPKTRDFGYPVDWAVSIIGARLESKFAEREEDNVLVFQVQGREVGDERRS